MELITDEGVLQVWDAAHCPDPIPDGFAACLVYVGGTSAAHVWDDAELARVAHLPRLPVWVPTPGHDNPRQVAIEAAHRLAHLGVPDHPDACGNRPALLWDMETGKEPDPSWYDHAANALWHRGYANLGYASPNVARALPIRSGIVVARPDTQPVIGPLRGELGTQYSWGFRTPGGTIDRSVFRESALGRFWMPS